MDPIAEAVSDLQEQIHAFNMDGRARILHVLAEPEDATLVTKTFRAEEWNAENRSPFLIFETPYDNDRDAFSAMSRQLREHYALLREGVAEEGTELPAFDYESPPNTDPLAALVAHLGRWIDATGSTLNAPMICWLPTNFGDATAWVDAAIRLIRAVWNSDIRFALRDDGEGLLQSSLETVEHVMTATFHVDPDRTLAHFGALLGTPSAGRAAGTLPGAAAPDVAPPPRPRPLPSKDQIREARERAGLPPMPDQDQAEHLRRLILEAATAAGNQDEGALTLQHEACALCRSLELPLEEVVVTMILASYLLQFGKDEEALVTYRRAEELSCEGPLYPQLAQVRLAVGYLYLKDDRMSEAIEAYEQAAVAASIGEVNLLLFEALRLAGTCHGRIGNDEEATTCWGSAVNAATRFSSEEIRMSTFSEVASSLLDLLRRRGLHEELHTMSATIEEIGATVQA